MTSFAKSKWCQKKEHHTDHDQNLISSEGDQDTSAHRISGHSSYVFSWKCQETSNLMSFTKSRWRQKEDNQQTVTKISEGGQDTLAHQIWGHSCHVFWRKCLETSWDRWRTQKHNASVSWRQRHKKEDPCIFPYYWPFVPIVIMNPTGPVMWRFEVFFLFLSGRSHWTNTQVAGDLRRLEHETQVTSFWYYNR